MSRFCADLSIVGMSTEFDGSPDVLECGAKTLRTTAQHLNDAAANIRKLTECGNELESQAYGALGTRSRQVYDTMNKVAMRYRMMATAVSSFAEVLRTEQSNARKLLENAQNARTKKEQAQSRYNQIRELARTADPCALEEAKRQAVETRNAYLSADASLASARQALKAAAQRIKEANCKASTDIRNAMEVSGLDDSFWDKLCDLGATIWGGVCWFAKLVWDNIEVICLVIDVVSVVLLFIPGVGTLAAGASKLLAWGIKATVCTIKGIKIASTVKKGIEVCSKLQAQDYQGAALSVIKFGTSFLVAKGVSKAVGLTSVKGVPEGAVKAPGRAVRFSENFAKKAFSVDSRGVIKQTRFGRLCHNLGERAGGPTFPAKEALPSDFLTQHVNRTTKAIAEGVQGASKFAIKFGSKEVAKVLIPDSPPQNRTYAFSSCQPRGIEAFSGSQDSSRSGGGV